MKRILLLLTIHLISSIVYSQQILPKLINGHIKLDTGTYVLPIDLSIDFGDMDITIEGVPGQSTITSYDGTPETDFRPIELDTNIPDTFSNGLYVVANHPYISYGGGYAHLKLTYNTGFQFVFYTMGTILKKENGIWSRHFTGYGFKTRGNITLKNIIFDNCQFYILSPFGQTTRDKLQISNCTFKNVSRVISSITYAGIDHKPDWYNALNYYSAFGKLRFKSFEIDHCNFEKIHTSIVWGFPPSEVVHITNNTIRDCNTMITAFNLFIKFYNNENYFNDKISQIIRGNTFINIKSSQNWQTALIRTSGIANVSDNHFIDCTQQFVLVYGENFTFSNNIGKKINTNTEWMSPVILIKSPTGINTFTGNTINSPYSTFVALEGNSSCSFIGNTVTGKTFYSRVDRTNSTASVKINNNTIQCATITNISSATPNSFKTVEVSNNTLTWGIFLNTGITNITNYVCSGNTLLNCYFPATITQATNQFYDNNQTLK